MRLPYVIDQDSNIDLVLVLEHMHPAIADPQLLLMHLAGSAAQLLHIFVPHQRLHHTLLILVLECGARVNNLDMPLQFVKCLQEWPLHLLQLARVEEHHHHIRQSHIPLVDQQRGQVIAPLQVEFLIESFLLLLHGVVIALVGARPGCGSALRNYSPVSGCQTYKSIRASELALVGAVGLCATADTYPVSLVLASVLVALHLQSRTCILELRIPRAIILRTAMAENVQMAQAPATKKVNIHELLEKFQNKTEVYNFLVTDCKAYLPKQKSTNVYFFK
jgi:hypothetical protein